VKLSCLWMASSTASLWWTPQKPEEVTFWDLGAGIGKLLFAAAMMLNFKACVGLEAVPAFEEVFQRFSSRQVSQAVGV
jgi:hypothetical protein